MARSDERVLFQCPWAREQDFYLPLGVVRAALAGNNLHVVTDAERRVLDAMGELDIEMLKAVRDGWSCAPTMFHPPCLAELARREGKQ